MEYTHQEDHTQYHQQYYQHHHHLQQQQQQEEAYDPSTIQPYDHSSYQFYNPQQYEQQQQYQYYNPATTTTTTQDYAAAAAQHQYHQEPTSIHPPGVPVPAEPPQSSDLEPAYLQNAYYPHGFAEDHRHQQQQIDSGSGPGGLTPAAMAALSQLSQISGNIKEAQRAIHQPIGQTPFRGGGRRGNRPFRGGGRGHFGYHGPRPDGSAPPFRGRGRGQGGGRHFSQYGAASTNPNSESVPAEGVAALLQPPSALIPGQAPLPVPTEVSSASFWRPPRMAWCELCRVDCNTPEILEQHKNGKRHKKNMQVHEELQKHHKVNTEQQNAEISTTELRPEVSDPVRVEGFERNQPLQENLTSEVVVTDDNRNETDLKDVGANSEASAEPDQIAARGRGSKRRMRGGRAGRGGKYMKSNEGSRRPIEPPKPKQVIPFICELCNVKCESQVVFDSHLSGKKHLATLKRFQGHRALYGEVGLQALYPPNISAASTASTTAATSAAASTSAAVPPVQQGVNDPPVLLAQLLMTYVLSQNQVPGTALPLGPASLAAPAPGTSIGTQNQLESQILALEALCRDGSQNPIIVELKRQLQLQAPGNTSTNMGNGTSEFKGKEQVSGTALDKECGVVSSDPIAQPIPENEVSVPESKNEAPTEEIHHTAT